MPRVAPPPAPPRMLRMRRGENFGRGQPAALHAARAPSPRPPSPASQGRGRPAPRSGRARALYSDEGEERCASGVAAHAPGRPLSPALSPASGGKGEFDRASAGPAQSTVRAVREGGLWAVVAATSVAPAGPGLSVTRSRRTATLKCTPLPRCLARCLWERVARVSARPGEGPTAAEASAAVTAAAPGLYGSAVRSFGPRRLCYG
jgi:hypothetical protein